MRKHNFLKAVATVLCMALLISGTAFAATPGQALDAKEVKYGTLSRADQNILKSMFNAEEYAAMNEDVVNAVGKDANKLFAHFIKYGVFEGRGPSKSFNVSAYMSSYGDLQKAFGKDIMAYYRHYNNYGKKEKRELVTVEKAEAAGVVIKSVTGATKTVLPPSVQNPSSGSGSGSSSSSSSSSPIVLIYDGYIFTAPSTIARCNYSVDMVADLLRHGWTEERYGDRDVLVSSEEATAWGAYIAANPLTTVYNVYANALTGCTSNAPATVDEGDSLEVTLTASSGYTLTGATVTVTMGGNTVDGAYSTSTNKVTIANVTGNVVIIASAVPETTYNITFAAGANGTGSREATTCTGSYTLPDSTGFTPSAGYKWSGWTVGGTLKAIGDTITVSGDTEITATFVEMTDAEKVAADIVTLTNASITATVASDSASATEGDVKTAIETAANGVSGLYFTDWTSSEISTPSAESQTVTLTNANVSENNTVSVTVTITFGS